MDEFEKKLKAANQKDKKKLLLDYIGANIEVKPKECIKYAYQLMETAKKCRNRMLEAESLNIIGAAYSYSGDSIKGHEYYSKSLELYQKIGNKRGEADLLSNMAKNLANSCAYDKMLEYCFASLKVREEIGDKTINWAITLDFMGTIYKNLNQYDNALKYYLKAISVSENRASSKFRASFLGNLGALYGEMGQYDKALNCFFKSLEIYKKVYRHLSLFYFNPLPELYSNIGLAYQDLNDFSQALEYFQHAIDASGVDGYVTFDVFCNIGILYTKEKKFDEAIPCFEKSLSKAEEFDYTKLKKRVYEALAALYSEIGDYEKAFNYQKLCSDIKEVIFSEETSRIISENEIKFKMYQIEKEKEALAKKLEEKNRELAQFAHSLGQKNEIISKLRRELSGKKRESSGEAEVLSKLKRAITTNHDWKEFKERFEKVHPGFIPYLSEKYPKLTPQELKICVFVQTKLTSKQIANILYVLPKTIEIHRYRIRKKLNLSRSQSLSDYLNSVFH